MNNALLDPSLSAMLAGTNLSIDPGALPQQQPLFETDTASSRTTSTSSVTRLSAPATSETEADVSKVEAEEEDATPKKPATKTTRTTRSKAKTPSKSRTATASSKSKRGGATSGTADTRRKRNLERNRAAASKCRQRKKQWQDGLERKKIALENCYKTLHSEKKDLMEEVAQLKNFVMGHAACGDANIDNWIRNEAGNFVRRMSGTQNASVISASPVSTAAASMTQMRSPEQGQLTAPPSMIDTLNNIFAPIAPEAPFDTTANTDLPPSALRYLINQDIDT